MAVSQIPKHLKYVSVLFLILLGAVPVAVRFWVGESQSGSDLFALSTAVCCGISILSAILVAAVLYTLLNFIVGIGMQEGYGQDVVETTTKAAKATTKAAKAADEACMSFWRK